MYLIRKTNQTNPERFTEKVKKKKAIIEKMDFLKHQTVVLDKIADTLAVYLLSKAEAQV